MTTLPILTTSLIHFWVGRMYFLNRAPDIGLSNHTHSRPDAVSAGAFMGKFENRAKSSYRPTNTDLVQKLSRYYFLFFSFRRKECVEPSE